MKKYDVIKKSKVIFLKIWDYQNVVQFTAVTKICRYDELCSVVLELQASKDYPAAWPRQIARGYISRTVDLRDLPMPKSTSGHKITL